MNHEQDHAFELKSPRQTDNYSIPPHGGELVNLIDNQKTLAPRRKEAEFLPFFTLSERQTADMELLLSGGFSPLRGFLDRADYRTICETMHLSNGTLWPIPITLDVPTDFALTLTPNQKITLRHPEGMILATLTVNDVWEPDKEFEAKSIFETTNQEHPGVFRLFHQTHPIYVGGQLDGLKLPPHHTFNHLRITPAELRQFFKRMTWEKIIGFQTRNPMHQAHFELTRRAMETTDAALLIHPAVGPTQPGDLDFFTRVHCYQAILQRYPNDRVALSLLPLAMRMAGPREALLHAIIRQNYGCTHFIIGRDHAGPKNHQNGEAFYQPYDAQDLAKRHQQELVIQIIVSETISYVDGKGYLSQSELEEKDTPLFISGSRLRELLQDGQEIPEWISFNEVLEVLQSAYPPRSE